MRTPLICLFLAACSVPPQTAVVVSPPVVHVESPVAPKIVLPGRVVFASEPIDPATPPSPHDHFMVGEPIYAEVILDEPMSALSGPNVTGRVTVSIAADGSTFECGGDTLRGENVRSASLLAARAMSVDAVRSPSPTRVRTPDITYLAQCFDRYESLALKHRPMTFVVRAEVSAFDGRVEKALAEGAITIDAADDAAARLVALRKRFASEATMRAADAPQVARERLVIDAVRSYAVTHQSTSFEPIAAAVFARSVHAFSADVAFRRSDGTCFVEPEMDLSDDALAHDQCASDAEATAVRAALSKKTDDAEVDVAFAIWEQARISFDRAARLHETFLISEAELDASRFERDQAAAKLHRVAPFTRVTIDTSACPSGFTLNGWPPARTAKSTRAREYEIACSNVPRPI